MISLNSPASTFFALRRSSAAASLDSAAASCCSRRLIVTASLTRPDVVRRATGVPLPAVDACRGAPPAVDAQCIAGESHAAAAVPPPPPAGGMSAAGVAGCVVVSARSSGPVACSQSGPAWRSSSFW
eukprot:364985-Chlamydomonas_euryale.AAC.1